jgi:hypothetical protein
MRHQYPPGNGDARHCGAPPKRAPHDEHRSRTEQTQTKPRPTTTSARIIARAQQVVDLTAILALDVAAIAGESRRSHHVRAALHLRDVTYHAWLAAEALLAEGVMS